MTLEDNRGAAGQLCTCVDEHHWSRNWVFAALAMVDLAHVVLTIINMGELAEQVTNLPQEIRDTNVRFRIDVCWCVCWGKVVTHSALTSV